jgi:hypothetical protein
MVNTEYMQLSPKDSGDSVNARTPRKKKKVGFYYLILDQVLGSGTFSKVYLGEMDPKELESMKKNK